LQREEVLGEPAEHLDHRLAVVQEHVAPHGRIRSRDAGEVAEAASRELHHLRFGHRLEIRDGADDVVGDEMRHVAGDRQHQVMVLRGHRLHVGAEAAPESREPVDRDGIGVLRRRQDRPAVLEQLGETGVGTRILGSGDGMGRDEMHPGRQVRRHLTDHRTLDGPHVRDDGVGRQHRSDRLGDRAAGPDRDAGDHQVGAPGGAGGVGMILVAEADFLGPAQHMRRGIGKHDAPREPADTGAPGDRRADEPDPDDRDAVEERGHDDRSRKALSAATVARFASSSPIVMRSASGRP
jgi:hypothetical protein